MASAVAAVEAVTAAAAAATFQAAFGMAVAECVEGDDGELGPSGIRGDKAKLDAVCGLSLVNGPCGGWNGLKLNVGGNDIGAEGAAALATSLERNQTLQMLNGVDDPQITRALERNKALAALAGTAVVLVELGGSEYPVTLPVTPSALAATDLAALARAQHPENLGPSTGSWQLQDPRVSEGDTTVLTLSGIEMATAFKAGTLNPTQRLLLVWSGDNDDD